MKNAGKSVLWFLAGCLIFTQAIAALVHKEDAVTGEWVVIFSFLSLCVVLISLLIMYKRDPSFLLAEQGDVRFLGLLKTLSSENNADLMKALMQHLDPTAPPPSDNDVDEDTTTEEEELVETEVDEGISDAEIEIDDEVDEDESQPLDEIDSFQKFLTKLQTEKEA